MLKVEAYFKEKEKATRKIADADALQDVDLKSKFLAEYMKNQKNISD